ncbi:phosphatase PAP2 family protein [Paraburkholderia sp. LEh10]|uniref:acid phosphatase n=1 Tax=Paraburkholderia sp. LEh10 TaxID=2821353 RepID=UPI001AE972DB|nr:phosphatase PAP2 family protein [Paraburkholderia sp. LEh10]MBP0595249.1 phosphatase PAP2 family protein [Paraburkholderia sp. LEh10]
MKINAPVRRAIATGLCALALVGTVSAEQPRPAQVKEFRPGFLVGYLANSDLPDSLSLVPAPPAKGSAEAESDEAFNRASRTVRDTARGKLAIADAKLSFPAAAESFSCALGVRINDAETPYLYQLMRRSLTDVGLSTYRAKNAYNRVRPFVVNNESICTPDEESALRKDGSYPSGHAAIGWAWALMLSELSPAQSPQLLTRGLSYGESRSICNVHWASDISAGRLMGAATVARLHGSDAFQADMKEAAAEIAAQRAKGNVPARDCTEEASALAIRIRTP